MNQTIRIKQLTVKSINPELFQPYGQIITPSPDGKLYDSTDAQLNLQNGIPRLYIMRLHNRGRKFHKINRHLQCTQCLGSLGGKNWLIAVAPPSPNNQPEIEKITAFRIPGDCFIKLDIGTWHAGPYFDHETVDFYNLELSDTNRIDHFTHNFITHQNLEFQFID